MRGTLHPTASATPVMVGALLRATRRAQGLTIAQVAEATGLTTGFISRVERNETSPSVASLVTICEVLSLPVGSLFEPTKTVVLALDDAPLVNLDCEGAVERLLTRRDERRVQMLRSLLEPGATGGPDLYTMNCEVEVVHVIRNRLRLLFHDGPIDLTEGDTITLSGKDPHSWINPTDQVTDVVWTLVPAVWSGSV